LQWGHGHWPHGHRPHIHWPRGHVPHGHRPHVHVPHVHVPVSEWIGKVGDSLDGVKTIGKDVGEAINDVTDFFEDIPKWVENNVLSNDPSLLQDGTRGWGFKIPTIDEINKAVNDVTLSWVPLLLPDGYKFNIHVQASGKIKMKTDVNGV